MRNIVLVILNLASVGFVLAFLLALANFLFGSKLAIKGAVIPGNIGFAIAFLLVSVTCGMIGVMVNRRNMRAENDRPWPAPGEK